VVVAQSVYFSCRLSATEFVLAFPLILIFGLWDSFWMLMEVSEIGFISFFVVLFKNNPEASFPVSHA
jgi:hypothetical protein